MTPYCINNSSFRMMGEIAKLLRLQLILQEFTHMKSKAHGFDTTNKMYGNITIPLYNRCFSWF